MTNLIKCSRCNKVLVSEEYDTHECMPDIKRWKSVKFTHYYISNREGKTTIGIRTVDGTKFDFEEILEDKEKTKIPYQPKGNTDKNQPTSSQNRSQKTLNNRVP